MDRKGFLEWLISTKEMKESAARTRVSNVAKIDKEYDINSYFQMDECQSLLPLFEYSKEDEREGNLPNAVIAVQGDYYTGMHTLKSALKLYIEYLRNAKAVNFDYSLDNQEEHAVNEKKYDLSLEEEQNDKANDVISTARYIGNLDGFKRYVKANYRNKVNGWTKDERKKRNGICEYCGKKAELQAAHKHGKEFKDVIKAILDQKYLVPSATDFYEVDLNHFEWDLKAAHTPVNDVFYFLCSNCHKKYDSARKNEAAQMEKVIEGNR